MVAAPIKTEIAKICWPRAAFYHHRRRRSPRNSTRAAPMFETTAYWHASFFACIEQNAVVMVNGTDCNAHAGRD
jgi:hypothetical protein